MNVVFDILFIISTIMNFIRLLKIQFYISLLSLNEENLILRMIIWAKFDIEKSKIIRIEYGKEVIKKKSRIIEYLCTEEGSFSICKLKKYVDESVIVKVWSQKYIYHININEMTYKKIKMEDTWRPILDGDWKSIKFGEIVIK
jgi:hypothetical protein